MNEDAVININPEIICGLSSGELEALAEGMLVPSLQARLNELIARSKERLLTTQETVDLDGLLTQADQLTLIKTRARYTMHQQRAGTVAEGTETGT